MAWTSVGYPGTVGSPGWARLHVRAGSRFGIASGWTVSGVAGTRLLKVTAGAGWGDGIDDATDADETVTCTANSSGVDRWDTVVVRRNHGSPASSFAVVAGSNVQGYAAGLNANPGVLSDQPIALVRVPTGATSLVGATVVPIRPTSTRAMVLPGALPPPPPLVVGDLWQDEGGLVRRWDGVAWVGVEGSPMPMAVCRVASNANATLAAGQLTRVSLAAVEAFDGVSVAGGRMTVQQDGLWKVYARAKFAQGGGGAEAYLSVQVDSPSTGAGGALIGADWDLIPPTGSTVLQITTHARLTAGQQVQVFRRSSASGVGAEGADHQFQATIELVRR